MRLTLVSLILVLQTAIATSQPAVVDSRSAVAYIMSCRKENGAFGPVDKEYTDLAWSYPAVHALRLLNESIPNPEHVLTFGSKSWMEIAQWNNGPWYWSFYQKANLYHLLGKDDAFESDVPFDSVWRLRYKPRTSYRELRDYPKGEFFDMASLAHLVESIILLKGTIENDDEVADFVAKRQAPAGGFTDDIRLQPHPADDRAHVMATHDAVMILTRQGREVKKREECIRWLQACQTPSGGFRWHPTNSAVSNQPDVWYTWAAVRALRALGAMPRDTDKCIAWLNSLQNADGGFGDRPGWRSRLYSTYYAVHTLSLLTGDAAGAIQRKERMVTVREIPEGQFEIFQAQHKTPAGGTGMVDSVAMMKLNLIGVKFREMDTTSNSGVHVVVERGRDYAEHRQYALEVLAAPENYSHKLIWFNNQRADHISNFLVPPNLSSEELKIYRNAVWEGRRGLAWDDFKERVIAPIRSLRSGNLFYPELDYTMVNAYMVYDDGLEGGHGYNAVPGAHFGNIDWVRHFPYKERWVGVLPIIADGDAHGNMLKWYPNLLQYRNVFIAPHYDFQNYIEASQEGRNVCVIVMPDGEVRYYGTPEAVAYLKKHAVEWQWWENKTQVNRTNK